MNKLSLEYTWDYRPYKRKTVWRFAQDGTKSVNELGFPLSPRAKLHQGVARHCFRKRFDRCSTASWTDVEAYLAQYLGNSLPRRCPNLDVGDSICAPKIGKIGIVWGWGLALSRLLGWLNCWSTLCLCPCLLCPFNYLCPLRVLVLVSILLHPFFVLCSQWRATSYLLFGRFGS